MPGSVFYRSGDVLVALLAESDVYDENICHSISESLRKQNISKLIIDVSGFSIVLSRHITALEKMVAILKLLNVKTVVCGIGAEAASLLIHFVDSCCLETELDVETALNAHCYLR